MSHRVSKSWFIYILYFQVQNFCEETTAHGLGHAVKGGSFYRWFWYIIFLAAFAGNAYHLSTIVSKYLSYPSEVL